MFPHVLGIHSSRLHFTKFTLLLSLALTDKSTCCQPLCNVCVFTAGDLTSNCVYSPQKRFNLPSHQCAEMFWSTREFLTFTTWFPKTLSLHGISFFVQESWKRKFSFLSFIISVQKDCFILLWLQSACLLTNLNMYVEQVLKDAAGMGSWKPETCLRFPFTSEELFFCFKKLIIYILFCEIMWKLSTSLVKFWILPFFV